MRRLSFGPPLTLRGREFRGPLRGWAGKPMHPPLTDVPIGAYTLAAALDVISFLGGDAAWTREFYRAATFVLIAGAAVSVFTGLTGLWDWLTTEKGTQARRTANAHAWTMIAMSALVLINLALRWFSMWDEAGTPLVAMLLSVATAALIIVGSTVGGSLVYDYGFNVENSGDHPVWHASEEDVYPGAGTPSSE